MVNFFPLRLLSEVHRGERSESYRADLRLLLASAQKLDANACFTHLLPHLPIIHTSILSFKTSPLSTPSQRNPPPPSIESPSVQYLVKIFAQIARFSDERWEQFSWPGALDYNCMAVKADMCGMDIQMVIPGFFTAERAPMGVDWSTCAAGRVEGCTERDPKKMKACSRVSFCFLSQFERNLFFLLLTEFVTLR